MAGEKARMTRRRRRLALIGGSLAVLGFAAVLALSALRDSIVFFNSPTDVADKQIAPGVRIRVGGLVKPGSLARGENALVRFAITDGNREIAVAYRGIVPDLFREGQGVVAEGKLDAAGVFAADTILAKHDENYMPREVVDALKKQGHWTDDYAKPGAAPAKR
jgi:cytochrome c-type biogenesis protein CcmE